MRRRTPVIVGLVAMITLIVGLDIGSLQDHFELRLIVNVGIVLVFGSLYGRFRRDR